MANIQKTVDVIKARKFKRGDDVKVRMNRGPDRLGKFVKSDTTGARGEWWEIKPHEKGAEHFRARPSCVTFA